MLNISAESFPDDSIIINLSNNVPSLSETSADTFIPATVSAVLSAKPASATQLIQSPPPALISVADESKPAAGLKTFAKATNIPTRRVAAGSSLKRSGIPLSKKSASVDSLHQTRSFDQLIHDGATNNFRRMSQRGYEHVQSKVKVDIENAREHENKRRLKFQRYKSMPETLYRTSQSPPSSPCDPSVVSTLRDQLLAKDRQLKEKDLLIVQLNTYCESAERESSEKLKLERKIEAMRMEIMEVNNQNRQYQEEMRQLNLKVISNSGSSASAASTSAGSYPASSGVHTNSSSGSSYPEHHISFSSSSGVSSSAAFIPSDDRFLHHRKSSKRTGANNGGSSPPNDGSSPEQYRMLESSGDPIDDIVLFDKSHNDCPIITSSSTSREFLELFNKADEVAAAEQQLLKGKRAKRRKRMALKAMRKRLRRVLRSCAPCLNDSSDVSDRFDGETSLLYVGLGSSNADDELVHTSQYNSFKC